MLFLSLSFLHSLCRPLTPSLFHCSLWASPSHQAPLFSSETITVFFVSLPCAAAVWDSDSRKDRDESKGCGHTTCAAQKLERLQNGLLSRATVASHLSVLLAAVEQQLANKRTPSASPRLSITVSVASHTQGQWHVESCICILHHCYWMEMFWVTVSVPLLIWLRLPERTLRARHRLADIYFTQVMSISLTLMLYLYKAVVKSRIPPRTVIAGFDMCVTFLATCTFLVATRQKLGEM